MVHDPHRTLLSGFGTEEWFGLNVFLRDHLVLVPLVLMDVGRPDVIRCTSMSRATEDTNRRMLRARDAMDRAYAEALDIPTLARIAVVSEAHFIRTFRAVFGETPHRYLQRRRVERAMFLLRTTDRPVTDICFETGFGSLGTFSRTFAAIVGESPTAYRRRGVVHAVPSCFAMAWTRPSTFTQPEVSSSGEARGRRASVPSAP